MGITHKWNGTVLTITSDSGTSSADLKGAKGDDGIRGPQGATGFTIGADGVIDTSGLATKEYVDTAISNIDVSGGSGLTTAQISALEGLFKVCAFIKSDVSAEYDAFKIAFSYSGNGGGEEPEPDVPTITLVSISATYTGGNVAVGTNVNSLTGITVKATYSDGSIKNVTGYTLSGTVNEGNNTITVTYQGKTTTFIAIGIAEEPGIPDGNEPVPVAMTSKVQQANMSKVGHYTDNGSTKYTSDGRFPATNGFTRLSENVFEEDTTLKISTTSTANAFRCYLFCSTMLEDGRVISSDSSDDLFYYIESSSKTFTYGWSKAQHEFTYTVKAGYKFGIVGMGSSEMDDLVVEVIK